MMTLMKKIKDDTSGKASCDHGLEDLTLLKFLYYSKVIYRFNAIPIKKKQQKPNGILYGNRKTQF